MSIFKKFPMGTMDMNLQMFAEEVIVVGSDNDPPPAPLPEPTPKGGPMPSDIAPEAWRNVEEMLVTLSNNVRIQISGLEERQNQALSRIQELSNVVESGISELRNLMQEFKTLLHEATVEVPEEEHKRNEEQKDKKDNPGWLSRKGK